MAATRHRSNTSPRTAPIPVIVPVDDELPSALPRCDPSPNDAANAIAVNPSSVALVEVVGAVAESVGQRAQDRQGTGAEDQRSGEASM
jgi:hypothetical protein